VASRDAKPTLATVAASAGVSVATVSKVVNGQDGVGAATRQRVESLLREQDYIARRPQAARANTATARIELLFTGDLTGHSNEVMQGLLEAAAEIGVAVAISIRPRAPKRSQPDSFGPWARDLAAAGRQAVIAVVDDLTPADVRALNSARLPLVVIDPSDLPHPQAASVGSTNFAGGLAATQHLLSLGHRRIAYLGGRATAACDHARMHGYLAAMQAAAAPIPEGYIRNGDYRYRSGFAAATVLLDLPEPPTAVFAGSDEIAAAVIEAARERGLRIPEDLSIVGFDDTQLALYSSPPLTTVRQPLREIGRVALRTALRLAAGEKLDSHHVELATELIVRRSTAPPPTTA
jgi:LacI family transcriptional regulator